MSEADLVVQLEDLTMAPPQPLLRIGLIADVQYADAEDAVSFHGVPRFYRNSLLGLRRALDAFKREDVAFVLDLGDMVDGKQRPAAEAGFDTVLACFEGLPCPAYHLVGNHDLYNLPRPRLNERLGIEPAGPYGASYYSFSPAPALRVIVLDAYDLSLLDEAQGPDHPLRRRAEEIMAVNPNANKHSPDGLEGLSRRFVEFGGGVSAQQLAWLAAQLAEAKAAGQRALVAGHIPFAPGTAPTPCLLWNYDEVLALLEGSGIVVATLAGHAHMNGYTLLNGIHHIVLPSILETPPGRDAFAVLDVYPTCLALRGHDACMSLLLRFAAEGEGEEPGEAPAAPAALLPALAAALGDAAAAVAAGGCGKGAAAERQGAKVPVAARA